ncbi:MAG: ATP-NAD kinase [Clostridia bacterium]|nr:ATP-NAD kinase [Clostridia bacterium]
MAVLKVGIIVNPFSGKDLRRITSHASNVGNSEKVMKVVRMINSMKRFGIEKVYLMPDNYMVNASVAAMVHRDESGGCTVELLDFIPTDRPEDTIKAVEMMKDLDVACLIVLGGDGTCRLVAKTDLTVPIIPVSTGTNNVYPEFWEGTTVGIAASYIAQKGPGVELRRGKKIEISVNGTFRDIALVDAVITDLPYVGSRVVKEIDNIKEVMVTMCSPVSVGFSAIVGNIAVCRDNDDFGYRLKLAEGGRSILSPVSPGQLTEISFCDFERIDLGSKYVCCPDYDGTIALDGERTVSFRKGDRIEFVISRTAPYKVDVKKTLCQAVENNFFQVNN